MTQLRAVAVVAWCLACHLGSLNHVPQYKQWLYKVSREGTTGRRELQTWEREAGIPAKIATVGRCSRESLPLHHGTAG